MEIPTLPEMMATSIFGSQLVDEYRYSTRELLSLADPLGNTNDCRDLRQLEYGGFFLDRHGRVRARLS